MWSHSYEKLWKRWEGYDKDIIPSVSNKLLWLDDRRDIVLVRLLFYTNCGFFIVMSRIMSNVFMRQRNMMPNGRGAVGELSRTDTIP